MSNNKINSNIEFHNNSSSDGDGLELIIPNGASNISIEVISTSSDAVINFEVQGTTGEWYPKKAILTSGDYSFESSFSINGNSTYETDLTAMEKIRCRISNMTNGVVSVIGRVVG